MPKALWLTPFYKFLCSNFNHHPPTGALLVSIAARASWLNYAESFSIERKQAYFINQSNFKSIISSSKGCVIIIFPLYYFWPEVDSSGAADLVPRRLARLGLESNPGARLLNPNKFPRLMFRPPLGLNWRPGIPPPPCWLKSPSPKLFWPLGLASRHSS